MKGFKWTAIRSPIPFPNKTAIWTVSSNIFWYSSQAFIYRAGPYKRPLKNRGFLQPYTKGAISGRSISGVGEGMEQRKTRRGPDVVSPGLGEKAVVEMPKMPS